MLGEMRVLVLSPYFMYTFVLNIPSFKAAEPNGIFRKFLLVAKLPISILVTLIDRRPK